MPPRQWKLRVEDILGSISTIQKYVKGMDFEGFKKDGKTIDAVIRHFIIIGEAAGCIPASITDLYPDVPWRQMRDMRNIVVHGYFMIKIDVLWGTIQNDLPSLIPFLSKIVERAE